MFNFLERLRKEPIAARKKIALLAAGSITLAIGLFWLVVLTTAPKEQKNVEEKGPLQSVGENVNALFSDVKRAIADIKSTIAGSVEVLNANNTPPAAQSGTK